MPRFIVAIDNGSQSTKVSIIDENGAVHASGRSPLRPYASNRPGVSEHPDDDVWESIVQACRSAMSSFEGEMRDIVAVGLCTIRFCRALLDERGRLAHPIMSWMDSRVSEPYVHVDERVKLVTTSSGYITGRLTGTVTDFAGNVQGRWPVDPSTWRWSDDDAVIEREGIPRSMLAPLALPGEVTGVVSAEAALATGLPAGVPVVATSNDKAVEALGCGTIRPGQLLLSLGTYVAAMTPAGHGEHGGAASWLNFSSMPHQMLLESDGVRRGMWTVSWYRDLVFGSDSSSAQASGTFEHMLELEAERIAPGAGGVTAVLDWLAPTGDEKLRGTLLGFDGSQGRPHIYRALLESLAMTMHENTERMLAETGRQAQSLVVSGGGASSDLMMRILAAVHGVPTVRMTMTDAAGLGSAICAAVGTGVHPSWEAAADAMVHVKDVWVPEPDLLAQYASIGPRFRSVRNATRNLYRALD
ncbi:sugar kinase [Pseudoclavibacter sp. AY1F1]|uniref:FGGY-family carbohydrate kinase n=1 Tax=Pseudoclavibacter sp. AY1F1 TaxID=2080583 RepID=UPI000CE77302|nr:FGGY family carbohydrate kinase [Pseudoclavibacter sp. AY1F1]PPF43945.1 sugar kinase [Pseudoclavibacter sp. AY1F1]